MKIIRIFLYLGIACFLTNTYSKDLSYYIEFIKNAKNITDSLYIVGEAYKDGELNDNAQREVTATFFAKIITSDNYVYRKTTHLKDLRQYCSNTDIFNVNNHHDINLIVAAKKELQTLKNKNHFCEQCGYSDNMEDYNDFLIVIHSYNILMDVERIKPNINTKQIKSIVEQFENLVVIFNKLQISLNQAGFSTTKAQDEYKKD